MPLAADLQSTIPRWCRDCRLDLFLSEDPLILSEDAALCDICKERMSVQVGGPEREIKRIIELRSRIRDLRVELDDIDCEIRSLEDDKDDILRTLKDLTRELKGIVE